MPRPPRRPSVASRLLTGLLALTLVAGGLVAPPLTPPVAAATIAVTSTTMAVDGNDGLCTLIEAINAANSDTASGPVGGECPAGNGADTIVLQAGATYTMTSVNNAIGGFGENGLPPVASVVTVQGNSATIERSDAAGTPDFRILFVALVGSLTLDNVHLRKGKAGIQGGGAVYSDRGPVTLLNSTISDSHTTGPGGGLRSSANITVTNSAFQDNSAEQGGGGISTTSNIAILQSSFSNNSAGYSGGAFEATGSSRIHVSNSAFTGNDADESGGAISALTQDYGSSNPLAITGSLISGNLATSRGGGVYSLGSVTVANSTISNNALRDLPSSSCCSDPPMGGGGMYAHSVVVTDSFVTDNRTGWQLTSAGGGIASTSSVEIRNSQILRNTASGWTTAYGGAVYSHGNVVLLNSAITDSTATTSDIIPNTSAYGGGIRSGGVTASNSTIANNVANAAHTGGGGISSYGFVSLNNSTVSGNSAGSTAVPVIRSSGGGLSVRGGNYALMIANSTISDNTAAGVGSGIEKETGTLGLQNATVTRNKATGTYFPGGGIALTDASANMANTVVAGNLAGSPPSATDLTADCAISPTSLGHNLVGTGTGCSSSGSGDLAVAPSAVFTTVLSDTLSDNGGPTLTHLPLPASPLIDAGDVGVCASDPVKNQDQRGYVRPAGAACDIGAVEAGATAPTPTPSATTTPTVTATLSVTLTPTATTTMSSTPTASATPSPLATITVTSTSMAIDGNDGLCTLLEAITAANTNSASGPAAGECPAGGVVADTIVLQASSTYTLTAINNTTGGSVGNGLPAIVGKVALHGNGATIERSSATGTPNFRLFYVGATANLTLDGVTLRNGNAGSGLGGSIYSQGSTVAITNSIIRDSAAAYGGGVFAGNSTVTIANSIMTTNTASTGGGGGIYTGGSGSMTVTNTLITLNAANSASGGGIYGGPLTLIDSNISDNTATNGSGGGIYGGPVTMTNSTISGNSAVSGGGGGIHAANATITNSTISGNAAILGGGGGIYASVFAGTFSLTNSTIAGNTAVYGDGIFAPGSGGTVTLANSILAGNGHSDCDGYGIISIGHTIHTAGCPFSAAGDITVSSATVFTTVIGPLANNGGPTLTHLLLPGSPAIDAGNVATCDSAPVNNLDQRGVARPIGPACDIGSTETSAPAATPTATPSATPTATPTSSPTPSSTSTAALTATPTLAVAPTTPQTPLLLSPDNNATGVVLGAPNMLRWRDPGLGAAAASHFRLLVRQGGTTRLLVEQPLSAFTVLGSGPSGTDYAYTLTPAELAAFAPSTAYNWQVGSRNAAITYWKNSSQRTFTTAASLSPSGGAATPTVTPSLPPPPVTLTATVAATGTAAATPTTIPIWTGTPAATPTTTATVRPTAPQTPRLVAPAANATGVDRAHAVLDWQDQGEGTAAAATRFQVVLKENWTTILTLDVAAADLERVPAVSGPPLYRLRLDALPAPLTLDPSTVHRWTIGARNAANPTSWRTSATGVFTTGP